MPEDELEDELDLSPIEVQSTVTDLGSWTKRLSLTVPAAAVTKVFDKVSGELAAHLQVPGFRPGKVPRAYVERMAGKELRQRVTAQLVSRALHTALDREKLDTVGEPEADLKSLMAERGKDLAFAVQVEVRPTFELGNYKGLPVTQEEVAVVPEEIERQLAELVDRHAKLEDAPSDAVAQKEDLVFGALRVTAEGAPELKDESFTMTVAASDDRAEWLRTPDSFLLGVKAGETRNCEGTVGESCPREDLRGKKAGVEYTVKALYRRRRPELNDDFARQLGTADLAGLRAEVEKELRRHQAANINRKVREDLVERLIAASPFELPKRLVEHYHRRMEARSRRLLARLGLETEGVKQLSQELASGAEYQLRQYLVLQALAEKENLEVNTDEVDEELVRMARRHNMRAETLLHQLEERKELEMLKEDLLQKKALEFLYEHAEIKVEPRRRPGAEADAPPTAAGAPPAEAPKA
jgi:trigger factor